MGQVWLDSAERRQVHGGWSMQGGPPRLTWHITWDALNSDNTPRVTASGIADYLNGKGYQPHLVWDPFTGQMIQLLPADVGGSALVTNNSTGDINFQIETLFTPGEVKNGQSYGSMVDTPLNGLAEIMALADSWGIPRVAPLSPGDRNSDVWNNVAGHYGHFNVPGNDHGDPICPIQDILDKATTNPTLPEEEDTVFILHTPDNSQAHLTDGFYHVWLDGPSADWWLRSGVKDLGACPVEVWDRLRDFHGSWAWVVAAAQAIYAKVGQGGAQVSGSDVKAALPAYLREAIDDPNTGVTLDQVAK